MLKELFSRFIDLLDAVLFEPYRAENVIASWGTYPLRIVGVMVLILAAISAGAGYVFITPPFTGRSFGQFAIAAIMHFGFFLLLPYTIAFIVDGFAQSRGKKGNANITLRFVNLSLSLFISNAAWGILLAQLGIKGGFGVITLYSIHYGLFMAVLIRGTSYIYDLKFRDSFRINIITFLITFFLPLAMYSAVITSFNPSLQ
ncbi:hypothetical protein EHQ52_05415 [Leptospira koniambonensis]|uniref:Yip1 domain-containing protein n=1 Tax=Leptospira koniambonensis TaxID=2484950 RepID=A0A4R9J870_9LEPT|nr:hypothetical protein [Leptospira koniambonensis]TGL33971.1 hypothetical protein EHQ52_05415 [Leptospira koniambonensis]